MSERIIKIKSKQPRIFPDHRGRNDEKHIVVGLLGNSVAVFRQQLPEIPVLGIGRHAADERQKLIFAPVVRRHHQQARRLRIGAVQVFQIARRCFGCWINTVPVIAWVRPPQVRQGPDPKAVFHGRLRDELPHAFGDPLSRLRPDNVRVKITLLERQVKKLRRQVQRQHFLRNPNVVSVLYGRADRICQPVRRLPLINVLVDLGHEAGRHVHFALAENACNAQDEAILLAQFLVIDMKRIQELVVALLHLLTPRLERLNLVLPALALGLHHNEFQPGDIHIKRLHVVKEIFGELSLPLCLAVLVERVSAYAGDQDRQRRNNHPIFLLLSCLDLRESLPHEHRVGTELRIFLGGLEVAIDVVRDRGVRASGLSVFGPGLFQAECQYRTDIPQANRCVVRNRKALYKLTIHINPVGALQIPQTPLAVLKNHFRVGPAHAVFRNANFAVGQPSDAERLAEREELRFPRPCFKADGDLGRGNLGFAFQECHSGVESFSVCEDDSASPVDGNRSATTCVANAAYLFLLALIPFLLPRPCFVLDRPAMCTRRKGTPLDYKRREVDWQGANCCPRLLECDESARTRQETERQYVGVLLEIKAGPFASKKITLANGKSILIGRAPDRAQFAIPHDNHMSGVHFAVECGPNGCRVIDKKSTNGTLLNGVKIQEAMLATGDEIKSGQTVFVVRIVPDDQLPAASSPPAVAQPPASAPREIPSPSPAPVQPPVVPPSAPSPSPESTYEIPEAPAPSPAVQDRPAQRPVAPTPRPPTPGPVSPARVGQPPALAVGSWAFHK